MDVDCSLCGKNKVDLSPGAVAALVDQIPIASELKASEVVMAERLSLCSACDALREGVMCAYCGCFVKFRARARMGYCPHPAGGKWAGVDKTQGV